MSFGLIYWILMLLWLLAEIAPQLGFGGGAVTGIVSTVLLFILFLLLGWKIFGPPVHP